MGGLGPGELILIALGILLLFGAKRLPEMGRSLGSGLREFKKGITGEADKDKKSIEDETSNQDKPADQ